MEIAKSFGDLVGKTPLMELARLERELNLDARLLAKLEYFNPAGSVKDRVAWSIVEAAEKCGQLKPGGTIIEPTSGNTGIGLAAVAAAKGYKLIVVMPDSMSVERRRLIGAYGAEIILTPGSEGMKGAIAKAESLAKEMPGGIIAGQFVNPANPEAHREHTGPEIFEDTNGQADIFIAGVGTGGTITGVGEYLKSVKPSVRIIAVEPSGSPVLSEGRPGIHKIQGIGAGFVPKVLNTKIYDEVIAVADNDAFDAARRLARTEGLITGISSGAALSAAIAVCRRSENRGKTVVALLPDSGDRYFSTPLFGES